MTKIPTHAQVVIVGGGIVGCSTAYHLAKLGLEDVVLLERHKLTSGSTFHAAGLVGQLRNQANVTQLLGHSIDLYNTLETETGLSTGWKMNGGLRLACNKDRMTELKRQATTAHSFGLEMHLLTPSEARDLWPLMEVDDVVGAAFLPTDGQANPADITQALAKGARQRGVTIAENCQVQDVLIKNNRVAGIVTEQGAMECEVVVNCCGQWAREFGLKSGVNIPLVSVQHQYLITEKIEGVMPSLPTLRDPDRLTYYKEDVGGIVMGGYERNPVPWAVAGFPESFNFSLLDSDWEHFEQLMKLALPRMPALEHAGIKELLNGPESFTPDGNFILGEAPEVKNYFVGAGFNAFGIASGGGAGKALAEWVVGDEAPYDLWAVDIRRFGSVHKNVDWVRDRTLEMYGKHYTVAWPGEEHESARPTLRSPLYDTLKKQGACFGEKMGWERPNWFADSSEQALDEYSFERGNWFEYVGREHKAARESAAVFDQSSFAKFKIAGSSALNALNRICANNVEKPVGSVIYTQMLNQRGGIECDLTVSRMDEEEFYLVTGTGFVTHDHRWIHSNINNDENVVITDVTSTHAVLSLMGPRSRDVLERCCDADLSDSGLPFMSWKNLRIAGSRVRAIRVTYVGELGYELHMATDNAPIVYKSLMEQGEHCAIANAGYRAIESLRLEKGYRAWGADITPDHTPLEAGLGWAVKLDSGVNFTGRDALLEQRQKPLRKRLACFTVEADDGILIGRETIYRNGDRAGWLSSAGFGYTVEKYIGYGYVRNDSGVDDDYLYNASYELEVATQRVPCQIRAQALYDPKNQKVKN